MDLKFEHDRSCPYNKTKGTKGDSMVAVVLALSFLQSSIMMKGAQ